MYLKDPSRYVYLTRYVEKTGLLRQSPNLGVDHSSLWIDAITFFRPFTINFDKNTPPFGII